MPRSSSHDAIILRTINVGEADRFCILLTRGAGRMTAMGRGVRKPKSRMGGLILPFRRLTLELSEGSAGYTISSASDPHPEHATASHSAVFLRLQQGIELLLQLTEEGEPLQAVFDLTVQFISMDDGAELLPVFQLRLLSLLGFLPATSDDARFTRLPPEAQVFIRACGDIHDLAVLRDLMPESAALSIFLRAVFAEHLNRPLKSEGMSW